MCKSRKQKQGYETPHKSIRTLVRLWKIQRAVGIKRLYRWQKDFIFGRSGLPLHVRANGKTMACIINLLMWRRAPYIDINRDCGSILGDPDYLRNRRWHDKQVAKAHEACVSKGIKVFELLQR